MKKQAATGLKQLEELGLLQEKQQNAQTELEQVSHELRQIFGIIEAFIHDQHEETRGHILIEKRGRG